jgi:hypothetical protein
MVLIIQHLLKKNGMHVQQMKVYELISWFFLVKPILIQIF